MSEKTTQTLDPLLSDIASVNIAKYCLLPDPRPEPVSVLETIKNILGGHSARIRETPILCINNELARSLPQPQLESLTPADRHSIFANACVREAAGRAKGQVRDFHDQRDMPQAPLRTPVAYGPNICRALLQRF